MFQEISGNLLNGKTPDECEVLCQADCLANCSCSIEEKPKAMMQVAGKFSVAVLVIEEI